MTGQGFYLNFHILENVPLLKLPYANIGNVLARIEGLENGAGFNMYIKDGIVKDLEGYCFDDAWPDPWPNDRPYKVIDRSKLPEIQIGKTGLVKFGKYKGWYVMVQETGGGYQIFYKRKRSSQFHLLPPDGFDDWVEKAKIEQYVSVNGLIDIEWLD
jgi:hypothetical protein